MKILQRLEQNEELLRSEPHDDFSFDDELCRLHEMSRDEYPGFPFAKRENGIWTHLEEAQRNNVRDG